MPLILIDGCEDSSSWLNSSFTPNSNTGGRNGRYMNYTYTMYGEFLIPAAQESDTLTMGFAFRINSWQFGGMPGVFIQFRSDSVSTVHTQLKANGDRSLSILRGSTVLATTAPEVIKVLPADGPSGFNSPWQYIELQVKLHATNGTYALRVNEQTLLTAIDVNTKNGGTKTTFDSVRIYCETNVNQGIDFDDLYLMAGSSDSFLGDIVVETLYPDGNGNANQWVGSDGNSVDNYLHVDDNPVSTSDYVASATAGQQDLYTMTNLVRAAPQVGAIHGICHAAHCAKTDVGARQVKLVNRRASDTKSAALNLSTTATGYRSVHNVWTQDPETSSAWTVANINALQSGVEVV